MVKFLQSITFLLLHWLIDAFITLNMIHASREQFVTNFFIKTSQIYSLFVLCVEVAGARDLKRCVVIGWQQESRKMDAGRHEGDDTVSSFHLFYSLCDVMNEEMSCVRWRGWTEEKEADQWWCCVIPAVSEVAWGTRGCLLYGNARWCNKRVCDVMCVYLFPGASLGF